MANSSTNRMNGTMAPSAAALTGLLGSSDVNHDATVGAWPPLTTSRAASAAPGGSAGRAPFGIREKSNGIAGITIAAAPMSSARNTTSALAPMRPMSRTSDADATPVTMSATRSGMTVMRMAVTQRIPTGASASATRSACVFPDDAMITPRRTAEPRAARTRVPSSMGATCDGSG